jgi:hypothetical protein
MNSKNKSIRELYRGMNEFKRCYQNRNNLVKDENGDLLADSHNMLSRWKESITVPVHKKGDKTDCKKYHGISLLLTSYKILSNIPLSRLTPRIDEIIWYHYCGFKRNISTTDQFFCTLQILEKDWECTETVHRLFIDFKKTYDSVRREVLCSIFIEFGTPMKLVRLIKMWLNETYSKVHIDKHSFDSFPIQNGLN